MEDSLEHRLEQEQQGAVYDSSGVFTLGLEQARAKMAKYALAHPETATLRLAQAFYRLGCEQLNVEVYPDHWVLIGLGGREFALKELDRGLLQQALGSSGTAENHLAGGLVGMANWPLEGARYQNRLLWGRAPAAKKGLVISFTQKAPPFPSELWRRGLRFCSMDVSLYGVALSGQRVAPLDRPLALEVFHGQGPLRLTPSGQPPGLWSGGASENALGSLALLLHPELKGEGYLFPVMAGLMLEPFRLEGFPEGVTVVFAAEGLGTDLGYFRIRDDEVMKLRLPEWLAQMATCLEALEEASQSVLVEAIPSPSLPGLATIGLLGLAAMFVVSPPFAILGGLITAPAWLSVASRRTKVRTREQETQTTAILQRYQSLAPTLRKLSIEKGLAISFLD